MASVVRDLEARAEEIASGVTRAAAAQAPEAADGEGLHRACRQAATANVEALLARLRAGSAGPADAPLDAVRHARLCAQSGLPREPLIRAYSAGEAAVMDAVIDAVERLDVPTRTRRELTQHLSHAVIEYAGGVVGQLLATHDEETKAQSTAPGHRRMRLVHAVLAGDDRGLALGYDLAMCHVGFVAWGDRAAEASQALQSHARRRILLVQPDEDTTWGWIGGFGAPSHADVRELFAGRGNGACFAFGNPAEGGAGFRATHDQARMAQRLGARAGRNLTAYRDVALEALALHDEGHALQFVSEEIGPLMGTDPKTTELRRTLSAYFAAGSNAACCAAALRVHEQTVAYRLRRMEERLGHDIAERRTELQVALRLGVALADRRAG